MDNKEFYLILNDILGQVKPVYLRKTIMFRLYNLFVDKNKEIDNLKKDNMLLLKKIDEVHMLSKNCLESD